MFMSPCKRKQNYWPTTPNIIGRNVQRLFEHPVACFCLLLGVIAQSFKPVKLLATCLSYVQRDATKLPAMLRSFSRVIMSKLYFFHKSAYLLKAEQQLCPCIPIIGHFSLHVYDVKMPNFYNGGSNLATTKLFFSF